MAGSMFKNGLMMYWYKPRMWNRGIMYFYVYSCIPNQLEILLVLPYTQYQIIILSHKIHSHVINSFYRKSNFHKNLK